MGLFFKKLRRLLKRRFVGGIARFHVSEPLVALTFDDGPRPESTPLLLDALKRHEAHATFGRRRRFRGTGK
jgi:peptidoglycan/xylan/chitin deacetylase (PgdA/CDA1 family)